MNPCTETVCAKSFAQSLVESYREKSECAEAEACMDSSRWVECVRAKRGLEDTSLPGGLAKDQSTFDGLVRILRFR